MGGTDRSLRILYIRVVFVWRRLVSRVFHFKLLNTSADLTSYEEPVIRPISIVLVKCWKVAHWIAKKFLKNCQKSKKLLPKFQKLLPKFLAIFI